MAPKKQTEPDVKAKTKATGSKKPVQKSEPVKPAPPAPEPVPVVEAKKEVVDVEESTVVNPSDSTIKEFTEFQVRLSTIRTSLSNLLQDLADLR